MRKPVLTIFYQFNPWHSTIGGIQTLIKIFLKYAPNEFEVRLVGTEYKPNQTIGKWQVVEFAGKKIKFLPLFTLENDNVRSLVPTTIKYTANLFKYCCESDFMHFHRLEPTLASFYWRGEKTLFIHNDIRTQMQGVDNTKAILWQKCPAAYFVLEKLLVSQFNQILSCNTDTAELYRQRYPKSADRIAYIKNSYDNEIFYPLTSKDRETQRRELAYRLGLPEETRFVLFAGRLHPQKDPILLVRTLAALGDPNVHLLIAGSGELEAEVLTEIGHLGLCSQVTMLGAVTQNELAQLHRLCSVFILTSAYEGLPLVVLEALASGTPVVTTKCGETPKFLTPNSGIVCSERTPTCIADAVRKILQHPENFPSESCVQAASPYAAFNVVTQVYNDMWRRWEGSRGRE
ncbi:glycosyltransferase [Scytonema sp. UIC 10036]|uniref:glycosyltransferase family 4 protein n=1 Tax=Scytonema sp. UIC 10036 TaxID=2304196 RepID=UPI0012DAB2E8|nr:glycosyltransferase family 4 protein [Scytonema sp. UIC 10036]MUG99145.1 glycosyltransferase [Scytonema sp. UIC 10036]